MQRILFVFLSCAVAVLAQQTWQSRAEIMHHEGYIREVMRKVASDLEDIGWCNLKIPDIHQNISTNMYKWAVKGKVHYFNGFLVSLQKLDITGIAPQIGRQTIDGVGVPMASITAQLIMRNPKLGFDLISDVEGIGEQRSTGEITLPHITITTTVQKELLTNETSVLSMSINNGGGIIRMIYKPSTNVTEVLSREFFPYTPNLQPWVSVIQPVLTNVIQNKILFPQVCFLNCH